MPSRLHGFALSPRRAARWLGVLGVALLVGASAYFLERLLGFRSPAFAFTLHFVLMTRAVDVDMLLAPQLSSRRFEVSARELRIYRSFGVVGFMRPLQRIGWHKAMRDPKVFDGTRRTLASYEHATRHGENAHACTGPRWPPVPRRSRRHPGTTSPRRSTPRPGSGPYRHRRWRWSSCYPYG